MLLTENLSPSSWPGIALSMKSLKYCFTYAAARRGSSCCNVHFACDLAHRYAQRCSCF